jgi:hypothetical protein
MSGSDFPLPDFYSQEDVQHILNIAIAKKTDPGDLTRSQLWEIASELEIDRESLVSAELDWLNNKFLDQKREEFNRFRRDQLRHKAVRYLIINSFLIVLNLISAHALTWSFYGLLILGLPLALEAWKTWQTQGESYELAFQRWKIKNEVKQSITTLWNRVQRVWQA